MSTRTLSLMCAILFAAAVRCYCAVSSLNVAVVSNQLSSQSGAVGRYYCATAGIPLSHLIEVSTLVTESMSQADFASLAQQIRSKLIAQLGVDPDDPANDPIQVLVMCYGVPNRIGGDPQSLTTEMTSVDSYLTMLFNDDPDLGPGDIDGDWSGSSGCAYNPYYGNDIDFATFRASTDNAIPYGSETYKMRYLVCRFDGYSQPTVNVTGYGTMPKDIKDMIDRGAASASQRGRFVMDEAWRVDFGTGYGGGGWDYPYLRTIIEPELIVHDRDSSECYVKTFDDQTGVIAYASGGMHDTDILESTEWGRPYFNWKPGAISIVQESYSGIPLRQVLLADWDWFNITGDMQVLGEPVLRVVAGTYPFNGISYEVALADYRIALLDDNGTPLKWTRNNTLVDVEALVDSQGVAEIDLSDPSIQWPQAEPDGSVRTCVGLYFPDDDHGYHDGEQLVRYYYCRGPNYSNPPYGQDPEEDLFELKSNDQGLSLGLEVRRQKASEYIRGGCSGTTAAVSEPGTTGNADTIFTRYAKGYSWAESAYMGIYILGYKILALGDPLMAPFADYPSLSFLQPTPEDGKTVKGLVPLGVTATPDLGSILRVEFYATNNSTSERSCVGTDTDTPFEAVWDTAEMLNDNPVYPDGDYTIEAVVYQDERAGGGSTSTRSMTLDNAGLASVTITQPDEEYSIVTESTPVQGQAGGSPSKVEFWLFGDGAPVLAGTATASPYQCGISTLVADNGVYEVQAVAYYDSQQSISFSPRRTIVLANDVTGAASVSALADVEDGTELFLVGVPVTSATSVANDGGFYVEDYSRAAGIRVQFSESISKGREVTVSGVLHTIDCERYIQAARVWDMGAAEVPKPLSMATRSVGGAAPEGIVGVSGGIDVYNTGVLITLWGRVTGDDSDFIYIDDGSYLQDDSGVLAPIPVPLRFSHSNSHRCQGDSSVLPRGHSKAWGRGLRRRHRCKQPASGQ